MPVQSVVSRINRQLGDVDFGTGTCGPGSHREILENTCPASLPGPQDHTCKVRPGNIRGAVEWDTFLRNRSNRFRIPTNTHNEIV